MYIYKYAAISIKFIYTENGNGSSVCFLQKKTKTEVCFLCRQAIKGNRSLLFQQACPSMTRTIKKERRVFCLKGL